MSNLWVDEDGNRRRFVYRQPLKGDLGASPARGAGCVTECQGTCHPPQGPLSVRPPPMPGAPPGKGEQQPPSPTAKAKKGQGAATATTATATRHRPQGL